MLKLNDDLGVYINVDKINMIYPNRNTLVLSFLLGESPNSNFAVKYNSLEVLEDDLAAILKYITID
jgi:hypothetical protein